MRIRLKPKHFGALLPTDILFQTVFWGDVKSRVGWEVRAFDIGLREPSGDILVLTRSIGRGIKAAYVPQGPEFGPDPENYGFFLEELSEAMAEHLDPTVAFIRYDLPWESHYAREVREQIWPGRPEPRLREMRMNFGTKSWNLRKTTVDMTVADTMVVDIRDTEEAILSRMKPKTRYNIRLAGRKGVEVSLASAEKLPAFYGLYCQTAARNGFFTCGYQHFSALFSALTSGPGSPDLLFLLASRKEDLLAGAIIAISGRTAVYLFGASSTENRSFMGSYAVQWDAIRRARSRGCMHYDMGAVSPALDPDHPFHGLYRFKTGFGGRIVHRCGSWDYPFNQDTYDAFRKSETAGGEFENSRKVHNLTSC
ncbi:lipid II:glycine glycyltransferase FemX [Syntrophorhabdus aromaticivorans]|uniref:Peptidoglycan bridge formation glycyltransferase FemA/FemB family protein n=1 Tax=Syntrophorhabdus aromaticivorans TaxID=328301 RepID=A0A971M0W1_9BACT|nr:peptidoglycan bridge formation glycyltransferase FemA/FemB family protein [Syntrophorhabdus aromaticivorans]NLW33853.1 peptidoglycan bridge formation glycyltransferase FemA/FemB family protein [Syntrophorhabdus aromaticivorans]